MPLGDFAAQERRVLGLRHGVDLDPVAGRKNHGLVHGRPGAQAFDQRGQAVIGHGQPLAPLHRRGAVGHPDEAQAFHPTFPVTKTWNLEKKLAAV